MAYKVRIEVGRGKNLAISESIPLPNKQRVASFIKRSPLVKSNTNVKVTNLRTKKTLFGKSARFCNPNRF